MDLSTLGHLLGATSFNLGKLLLHVFALLAAALNVVLGALDVLLLLLERDGRLFDLFTHELPLVRLDEACEALKLRGGLLVFEVRTLLSAELLQLGVNLLAKELSRSATVMMGLFTHILNLLDLLVLLCHSLDGLVLALLEHARTRCLLHHAENLGRLHVEHLGDLALHDEEVGVVDVQLHRLEEVLNRLKRRLVTVEQIFGHIADRDLTRHRDLGRVLKADGRFAAVLVVENNSDGCLGNACLATVR